MILLQLAGKFSQECGQDIALVVPPQLSSMLSDAGSAGMSTLTAPGADATPTSASDSLALSSNGQRRILHDKCSDLGHRGRDGRPRSDLGGGAVVFGYICGQRYTASPAGLDGVHHQRREGITAPACASTRRDQRNGGLQAPLTRKWTLLVLYELIAPYKRLTEACITKSSGQTRRNGGYRARRLAKPR